MLNSAMLGAAFLGALVFGRFADLAGRKRVYWLVAVVMIAGAVGSALAPSFWVLIAFRFLLGLGVGGDYPVSAVMMSEYANRADRGKLVGPARQRHRPAGACPAGGVLRWGCGLS